MAGWLDNATALFSAGVFVAERARAWEEDPDAPAEFEMAGWLVRAAALFGGVFLVVETSCFGGEDPKADMDWLE